MISRACNRMWSVGVHVISNAVGMLPPALMSGIQATRARVMIWPTPIVAMSSTNRGDVKSRRTTISSTTMPMSAVARIASANANHQLRP